MGRTEDSWGLAPGEALTPELTVMRRLGGGSSYEAWLAFDELTFAPVVVKVLRPSKVGDERAHAALEREAVALAAVNHPVVVRGLRHTSTGPRPHLVLEQADGPRLSTLVRRHGPLQEQQYLPLALDVASVLHYLRHVGYVHLDIKPSNIIMGAPARVIDLSVARPVTEAAALRTPIGTDAYMAPEQCDPGRLGGPTPASDVWGLGRRSSRRSAARSRSARGRGSLSSLVARLRWDGACPTRYAASSPQPSTRTLGCVPLLRRSRTRCSPCWGASRRRG
ncbi:serine/threonine-protein kinase [Nocardioides daphniae]|uniref:serine/threonine-protein kinase n=1 Tax=Nocardioides daphniae TaxID=402297 RepID=UPI001EE918BA|nr:serine/threonine-protein kinase [Nocardioides daphniae]